MMIARRRRRRKKRRSWWKKRRRKIKMMEKMARKEGKHFGIAHRNVRSMKRTMVQLNNVDVQN